LLLFKKFSIVLQVVSMHRLLALALVFGGAALRFQEAQAATGDLVLPSASGAAAWLCAALLVAALALQALLRKASQAVPVVIARTARRNSPPTCRRHG
jgi:hypothetical protein